MNKIWRPYYHKHIVVGGHSNGKDLEEENEHVDDQQEAHFRSSLIFIPINEGILVVSCNPHHQYHPSFSITLCPFT